MGAKEPVEEVSLAVNEWNCELCTILNQPGKSACSMCGASAPEAAYQTAEAKQLDEEEKARLEKEEQERKAKEEEERKQAEELKEQQRLALVDKEFEATQTFLKEATIEGYVFSSVETTVKTPALLGGLLFNKREKVADLHLKSLSYRHDYLANFYTQIKATGFFENKLTHVIYETEAACIASIVHNNDQLLQSLYPAHLRQEVLQASEVAVVRLPLSEVALVAQLSDHLSPKAPLKILVRGKNHDDEHATYLVGVELNERGKFLVSAELLQKELFAGVPNEQIQDVLYCGETQKLVVKSDSDFKVSVSSGELSLETIASIEGSQDYRIERGKLLVKTEKGIKAYPLQALKASPSDEDAGESVQKESLPSISAETVTIEDIEKFSSLLKGRAVAATSNSDSGKGRVDDTRFKRHFWKSDKDPWELQFDHKTSLISLNIDLTFSSRDCSNFKTRTVTNAVEAPKAEQVGPVNLGKFSLAPQKQSKQAESPDTSSLLPLIVHKHKGA
mmetsp:Transcript_19576/g.30114  ORF Transcript_19576/g.30114 Transcript_19576/m.30114 type:complete len:505 (+) Transcript_19576:2807-4321(+)